MRLTVTLLCATALMVASCNRKPDTETIRLYIRASDVYELGLFSQVTEILQKENKFPPALILRAKAEFFLGDIDKAENTFRRLIKLRPSSLEAHLYLARILREKGDITRAIKTTENILADNPQDIRSLRLAAELAMDAGKFDEAVILLDRAADYSAESAMVLLDRARLRWISGITNDESYGSPQQAALEDLSRARAMLPKDSPLSRPISNLEFLIRGIQ